MMIFLTLYLLLLLMLPIVSIKLGKKYAIIHYAVTLLYYIFFIDKIVFSNIIIAGAGLSLVTIVGIGISSKKDSSNSALITGMLLFSAIIFIFSPQIMLSTLATPVQNFEIIASSGPSHGTITYLPCCEKNDLYQYAGTSRIWLYTYKSWNILVFNQKFLVANTGKSGTYILYDVKYTYTILQP